MDEKARFALKRFTKAYSPGPGELTPIERIWEAWTFTQNRGVRIQELLANLPPETAHALRADARQILEEVTGEVADLGISCGSGPPVFDASSPNFIPYSFLREMVDGAA